MQSGVENLYYKVFEFECFIQASILYLIYPFFGSPVVSEMTALRSGYEPFQEYLFNQIKERKGMLAGRIVTMVLMFLLLTPWNFLCGVLQVHSTSIYWAGWIVLGTLALVV